MGCVLRVSGRELDPDAFLAGARWKACAVFRRGDKRGARRVEVPGFNVRVSDADRSDLKKQIRDAQAFLEAHAPDLVRLRERPGLHAELDFAVSSRLSDEIAIQCDVFPAELIRSLAEYGLGLELSTYGPWFSGGDTG